MPTITTVAARELCMKIRAAVANGPEHKTMGALENSAPDSKRTRIMSAARASPSKTAFLNAWHR